ncbi:unnamed protein product [Somion occarium]|uniref:DUF6593 domain-containing protein n=1 Tax=Somion occarium TaxID=3059160 RepID=A0ABP1EB80_9APHY
MSDANFAPASASDSNILSLVLTPNNPVNTTLVTEEGKAYYTVFTEHTNKASFTQVRDVNEEIIGSLEWRDTLPDKVTYGRNKTVSIWDWMKKSIIPFKADISFSDDQKRSYKWKGNSAGRSLELWTSDSIAPIALFHAPRRLPNPEDKSLPPIWTKAKLILNTRAQEIQDLVVTSFLFLEKNRRMNETTSQNAADFRGFLHSVGPVL